LLRGFLHAQTEMGFLQGLDLALKASDVFLT